jgi:hypothetical protein
MVNFEKIYQKVGVQIIERCHGAIKITKHGKIIQVYDTVNLKIISTQKNKKGV